MVDCFVRVNFQQLHEVCVDLIHSVEVVVLLFEELEGEARLRIENDLERPLIISVPLVEPVQYITFQLKALCLHLVLPALLNSSANRFRRAEAKQIFSCGNHVVLIEHAIFDGLARRPFPGVVLESVEALLDIVLVSSLDEVIQHFQLGDLKQLNFGSPLSASVTFTIDPSTVPPPISHIINLIFWVSHLSDFSRISEARYSEL